MPKEKGFITLTPGVNILKLFFSSTLTLVQNKLECFANGKLFEAGLVLADKPDVLHSSKLWRFFGSASKAGAYSSGAQFSTPLIRYAAGLTCKC